MDTRPSPLSTLAAFEKGALIADRYEVLQEIGRGGMGVVLKVRDRKLRNQIIALKLLSPKLDDKNLSAGQRLINEVLVARSLTHPNIVRIHDISEAEEGFACVSMEYVDGCSLETIIKQRRGRGLELGEALRILQSIFQGVSYAHSKGVIHRDLKPANILMSSEGECKIADFGLARMNELEMELTRTGETVGTPAFMAPEQFRAEGLDARSDIYALSILGYQMVSGRLPFRCATYFDMALKHMNEPMPPLSTESLAIPDWYEQMLNKAGAKKKEHRFSSVDEMLLTISEHADEIDHNATNLANKAWQCSKNSKISRESEYRLYSANPQQNAVLSDFALPLEKNCSSKKAWLTGASLFLLLLIVGFAAVPWLSPRIATNSVAASGKKSEPLYQNSAQSKISEKKIVAQALKVFKQEQKKNSIRDKGSSDETVSRRSLRAELSIEQGVVALEPSELSLSADKSFEKRKEELVKQLPETVAKRMNRRVSEASERVDPRVVHPVRKRIARRDNNTFIARKGYIQRDLLDDSFRSYDGSLSPFDSPGKPRTMTLSVRTNGTSVSGFANVVGWGKFNVSGRGVPNGLILVLEKAGMPSFKIKLNGTKDHEVFRGTFIVPSQDKRGRWEVTLRN